MTEATVTGRRIINGLEWVKLECSTGETYRSTVFKNITGVLIGDNSSSATHDFNAVYSGQTITITILSGTTTDQPLTLMIKGDI